MKILKVWLLAFGLSISFFTQAQVLTLAIEPTYPQSQLQTVFQPLCAWVKEKTGYELRLVSSQNYYYYWKDTHHKKPDLSFDAPHVASHIGLMSMAISHWSKQRTLWFFTWLLIPIPRLRNWGIL